MLTKEIEKVGYQMETARLRGKSLSSVLREKVNHIRKMANAHGMRTTEVLYWEELGKEKARTDNRA